MGLFNRKPNPRARIKIGQHFMGKKTSTTAEGYVIYKEWDATDNKHYYWEEWELRGFNKIDSWIEYDHYEKTVTLYEPFKGAVTDDPEGVISGKNNTITIDGQPATLTIKEKGVGIAARREGTLSYHVFEGDSVAYAEVRYQLKNNSGGMFSIEKYNNKEFDIYKGTLLSRSMQKYMLGRVVGPSLILSHLKTYWLTYIFFGTIFGFGFASSLPSYENYCTPRTTTTPSSVYSSNQYSSSSLNQTKPAPSDGREFKDEVTSQDTTQTCYRRTIYSGGSGGVGK